MVGCRLVPQQSEKKGHERIRGRARRTRRSHTQVSRVPGSVPGCQAESGRAMATLWDHAGRTGVPSYPPLDDPGTSDAPFARAEAIRTAPR